MHIFYSLFFTKIAGDLCGCLYLGVYKRNCTRGTAPLSKTGQCSGDVALKRGVSVPTTQCVNGIIRKDSDGIQPSFTGFLCCLGEILGQIIEF